MLLSVFDRSQQSFSTGHEHYTNCVNLTIGPCLVWRAARLTSDEVAGSREKIDSKNGCILLYASISAVRLHKKAINFPERSAIIFAAVSSLRSWSEVQRKNSVSLIQAFRWFVVFNLFYNARLLFHRFPFGPTGNLPLNDLNYHTFRSLFSDHYRAEYFSIILSFSGIYLPCFPLVRDTTAVGMWTV